MDGKGSAASGQTILTQRALNRALLARQGLLERAATAPLAMVERLVGMQAQEPLNPYVALWSRLERFEAEQLSELIAGRDAVRAQLMRATIHLAGARDCLALHRFALPVLARAFKGSHSRSIAGVADRPLDRLAAGRRLLPRGLEDRGRDAHDRPLHAAPRRPGRHGRRDRRRGRAAAGIHRARPLRPARGVRPGAQAAALRRPSAASTSSSCVFGDAFGITWRTTPCSSTMNVERSAPQNVRPYIDFAAQTP